MAFCTRPQPRGGEVERLDGHLLIGIVQVGHQRQLSLGRRFQVLASN